MANTFLKEILADILEDENMVNLIKNNESKKFLERLPSFFEYRLNRNSELYYKLIKNKENDYLKNMIKSTYEAINNGAYFNQFLECV